ncbi:CRISPR-associated endonuclease Cas1 [Candidatus Nitrosotenuis cloacae]|uniref:CRISPR-associated endonuclease Cas1 n=1 Tax=Candidatus Nitrosotenuis cloacae TaxID=1603555 RepID=UPI00227EF783|nr:CRISPR-associated endonuclease Cas1 [Candidatus Nitrosotenuis cloacae]
MNPLLISGFGTSINVEKRKLVIQNKLKNEIHEFYPHRIEHDSIIVDGHTGHITFESMRWLTKHNVSLSLLNWDGNLLSVTLPDSPISGKLRIKQYQKYLDAKTRHKIATEFVKSKIGSSLNLLKELSKFHDFDFEKAKQGFDSETRFFLGKPVHSIQDILGYEGRIARFYFDALQKIFEKIAPQFHFTSRSNYDHKRADHASDEINALFNYGYAILVSETRKAINSVGLDAEIGFLHEILSSRTPLVYDLQELFRWIIDYSIIQLLEDHKLKKSDFVVTENYHIRLRENTAKLLIEKIRFNFNHKMPYRKKNFTYQNILYDQIQQIANFISDKRKDIEFVVPHWVINRDDNSMLRNRILSLTPDQRRKLGINKSTLWYMKRNLNDGKTVKIYGKILSKLDEIDRS